jgi:hypothetical protein
VSKRTIHAKFIKSQGERIRVKMRKRERGRWRWRKVWNECIIISNKASVMEEKMYSFMSVELFTWNVAIVSSGNIGNGRGRPVAELEIPIVGKEEELLGRQHEYV